MSLARGPGQSGDQKAEKRGRLNPGKLVAEQWSLDQSPVGPRKILNQERAGE